MFKHKMISKNSLNFGGIVCLIIAVYAICYLLLQDDVLPFSIHSVLLWINHWSKPWYVLAVGLLPIYVAFMVFGTAILGLWLGSSLQRWIVRCLHK